MFAGIKREYRGSCLGETCSFTIPGGGYNAGRPILVFAKFDFTTPLGTQIVEYFEKLVLPCHYSLESELTRSKDDKYNSFMTKVTKMALNEVVMIKKGQIHKYCSYYAQPAPNMAVLASLRFQD